LVLFLCVSRTALRGLTKATIFFMTLLSTSHPSSHLQSLSQILIPLLQSQPRLSDFSTERDFTLAHHRWKKQVKGLRVELNRVPESQESRFDGYDNWWDRISDVVGLLEGREDVLIRVVRDLGGDWKEVCAAWGVFVDPRLRRQELPYVNRLVRPPTS
jgi:nuclear pore complex protein Nup85